MRRADLFHSTLATSATDPVPGPPAGGRVMLDWRSVSEVASVGAQAQGETAAIGDEELVRRFRSGEDRDGAFMALFERYGQLTYAFLRRRIGNPDVAAELNQDLYVGVLEGLARFRGESSFRTWLFRLAQYRLSNLRRRWRVHLDEWPRGVPEELSEVMGVAEGDLPDARLARDEQMARLRECLAVLPDVQRAVVIGQYYEGLTLEQLTRQLRLTNKSGARASLIAAQRKLRRCMEQAGEHGES